LSIAEANKTTGLAFIEKNQMPLIWDYVEPLLTAAIQHANGEFTIEQIIDGLMRGVYGLLVIAEDETNIKAAAIVEVRDHEKGSALWIVLGGGRDASEWAQHDDALKSFARNLGCGVIRMRGRSGWLKKLPHWRWVMELDI
jgi:hypothetical protein